MLFQIVKTNSEMMAKWFWQSFDFNIIKKRREQEKSTDGKNNQTENNEQYTQQKNTGYALFCVPPSFVLTDKMIISAFFRALLLLLE